MFHPPPRAFQIAPDATIPALPGEPGLGLRLLTWTIAAAITLGLHVGVFLALTRTEPVPKVEELPATAIMINLAPIPVTTISTTDNAADGPESAETEPQVEETAEAPEPPPPPPEPEPEVLPDLPPPPPEVRPDAVLPPTPPEVKPPEVKPPEVKPPDVKPPEQKREEIKPKPETPKKVREKVKPKKAERPPQVASKLGGGPVSNVQTGETSAAPTTGGKGASASMIDNWIAKVRSRILRAKRFPKEARGEDYGAATISVTFAPDGSVTAARITMSSGSPILDREALATVYRAAPYPKLPGGQPMTQKIALNFIKK